MRYKIKKVRPEQAFQRLYIEFTIINDDGTETESKMNYPYRPKIGLINAFRRFTPHFVVITENTNGFSWDDLQDRLIDKNNQNCFAEVANHSLDEIVIKEAFDSPMIQFLGKKKLSTNKELELKTPFQIVKHSEEDGDVKYEYNSDLEQLIERLIDFVIEYIKGDYDPAGITGSLFDQPPVSKKKKVKGIEIVSSSESDEENEKLKQEFLDTDFEQRQEDLPFSDEISDLDKILSAQNEVPTEMLDKEYVKNFEFPTDLELPKELEDKKVVEKQSNKQNEAKKKPVKKTK